VPHVAFRPMSLGSPADILPHVVVEKHRETARDTKKGAVSLHQAGGQGDQRPPNQSNLVYVLAAPLDAGEQ
jgi:hypothetical protein